MKTFILSSFSACAVLMSSSLSAGTAFGQAYVNQASPAGSGGVYLEQVPLNARPKPSIARSPKPAPQRQTAANAAVAPSNVQPFTKPRFPDVVAGSSAIVQVTRTDWPTVGAGTVRR